MERREHQLRRREVGLDRRFRSLDDLVSQASEADQKAVELATEKLALELRLKMLESRLANEKALAREASPNQKFTLGWVDRLISNVANDRPVVGGVGHLQAG